MQLGWHALLPPLRDRRRLAVRRRGRPTSSARRAGRRRSAVGAITDATTAFDALEARVPHRAAAAQWFAALDAAGVPCEVSTPDFVLDLFDDPEMIEKGWVTKYRHPIVGDMDGLGLLFDLSETPGVVQGPPLVPGQDTRAILAELGYDDDRIDKLGRPRGTDPATGAA